MYRAFDGREGERMSLPLPSHFGSLFLMTGVAEEENGRETGERTDYPPVPSALYTSAFEPCDGTKGGTFQRSVFFLELDNERTTD